MDVFLTQLKKSMLRKEVTRLLSKEMWMFLMDVLSFNYRNKWVKNGLKVTTEKN